MKISMRYLQVILSIIAIIILVSCVQYASAEDQTQPKESTSLLDIYGILTSVEGEPIPNVIVTIEQGEPEAKIVRKAVSDKNGKFSIKSLRPDIATITFEVQGYMIIKERGVQLIDEIDLSRVLKRESVGGIWILLLFIPGVLSLFVYAVKTIFEKIEVENILDRFVVALINGLIWAGTLAGLWYVQGHYSDGPYKLQFFHANMTFEFYVPVLGFLGSLLYVFDLLRQGGQAITKGKEEVLKGKEFGMRIIMGPYVAIVMVVLFTQDFNFINLTSPAGKGILAFFSGLLVVVAFQGLIERGNEWLGKWRRKSGESEIAKKFDLSKIEALILQKSGMCHLIQLRDCKDDELREMVRKVGFDENLAIGFKRILEEEQLKETIGKRVWDKLKKIKVETIPDFALLSIESLENFAKEEDICTENLKAHWGQAKKFGTIQ